MSLWETIGRGWSPSAADQAKANEQSLKELAALPFGLLEASIGFGGDIVSLGKAGIGAVDNGVQGALDGLNSPTGLPTTRDTQDWLRENVYPDYLNEMLEDALVGRLVGELGAGGGLLAGGAKLGAKGVKKAASTLEPMHWENAISGLNMFDPTTDVIRGMNLNPMTLGKNNNNAWELFKHLQEKDQVRHVINGMKHDHSNYDKLRKVDKSPQAYKKLTDDIYGSIAEDLYANGLKDQGDWTRELWYDQTMKMFDGTKKY